MSVTKQGPFTRSGPETADEVTIDNFWQTFHINIYSQIEIFRGEENMITLNQTHSKTFHCTYLLHYYPFDTQVCVDLLLLFWQHQICLLLQVCRVDLQLQKFAQDNVELVPDTIELLTDTELTQYYIQAWSLDYNDPGI